MRKTQNMAEKVNEAPMFGTSGLLLNSGVASVGAGAAMFAATGVVAPTLLTAVFGAFVGYTLTNQIPKSGE